MRMTSSIQKVVLVGFMLFSPASAGTSGENFDIFSTNSYEDLQTQASRTSLRQVIIIHRHGDRTISSRKLKDRLEDEPFWYFYGLGQLTLPGISRCNLLGKLLRERYNEFLGYSVNKNQMVSRASGFKRCVESADAFLASFLSLNDNNSSSELRWRSTDPMLGEIWQPVAVQSIGFYFDGLLTGLSCGKLMDILRRINESSFVQEEIYKNYSSEIEVLSSVGGIKTDNLLNLLAGADDIKVQKTYFENKVNPKFLEIYRRVSEMSQKIIYTIAMEVNSARLLAGLLLNDIIRNMNKFKNEFSSQNSTSPLTAETKRLYHYSTHDINILALLRTLELLDDKTLYPDYAATLLFELHQNQNDLWFVKIFYLPQVPGELRELRIDKCADSSNSCSLDRLSKMTNLFKIDSWYSWMNECNNDFDSDPYIFY